MVSTITFQLRQLATVLFGSAHPQNPTNIFRCDAQKKTHIYIVIHFSRFQPAPR